MDKVLTSTVKALGNAKNTNLFPIPREAPGDIPRLIAEYDSFRIQVSLERLDIFTAPAMFETDLMLALIKVFIEDFKITIKDLGYVAINFHEIPLDTVIRSIFAKNLHSIPMSELTLNVNSPLELSYKLNNIEQISWGNIEENNERKDGFIITRDINTFPSIKTDYELHEIKEAFALMKTVSQKTIIFSY
jgi:hypothetical protein